MVATYHVKPSEAEDFFRLFKRNYGGEAVTVTIDAPLVETQQETNARILNSAQAVKSGKPHYKTMSLDEFKAMSAAL
jgi:hypothetical protein